MKGNLLCLFLLIQFALNAQFAIVNDADGYTNLRASGSTDAEVLAMVPDGHVVFVDWEFWSLDTPWVPVFYDLNPFSIRQDWEGNSLKGYIHRSRLLNFEYLEELEAVELRFKLAPAREKLKYYRTDPKFPHKVYNLHFYGVETGMEKAMNTESLELIIGGDTIAQSPMLFLDLFNIRFEPKWYSSRKMKLCTEAVHGNRHYIYMNASDGAGGYAIIWVIENGRIIQRWVGYTT